MGYKVVYNNCYGGYGLSNKAIHEMNERGYGYDWYDMLYAVPRHNKDLVEVVESLGEDANGDSAKLAIYVLPDGCNKYRIDEYDGKETVETIKTLNFVEIEPDVDEIFFSKGNKGHGDAVIKTLEEHGGHDHLRTGGNSEMHLYYIDDAGLIKMIHKDHPLGKLLAKYGIEVKPEVKNN